MMVKNDNLLLFYYEETNCAVKAFVIIHVFALCPRGTVYMQLIYAFFSFELVVFLQFFPTTTYKGHCKSMSKFIFTQRSVVCKCEYNTSSAI